LAKRLQEQAQPGQVLISRSAYQMSGDLIETIALEPITVKGRGSPVHVYELVGLRCP
jgi:class 3 adenylate cyclase